MLSEMECFRFPLFIKRFFQQKESMNQEEAFIIEEDLIVPLWELYFRLFPEKLEELPSKIKISHCHRMPSFCGPDSHIRGIEFYGPTFGVDGLENVLVIPLIFSLGWLENANPTLDNDFYWWSMTGQWKNAHQNWYHDNLKKSNTGNG